jgi:hypothetical protein
VDHDGGRVISYDAFGRLRLADFLPAKRVRLLEDWEFEGRVWVGEAAGFSEWLRLSDDPEVLRAMAIDFESFPARAAGRVLAKLGLAVRKGMTVDRLEALLGPVTRTVRFVSDRKTYEFRTEGSQPYQVSCTVLDDGGLTYLGVMVPLPAKKQRRR